MVATANNLPPRRVLDLGGQVLDAKADMPLTLSPRHPITIRNGTLCLAGEQRLLVGGHQTVRLEGVKVVGQGDKATDQVFDERHPKGLVQVTGGGSILHLAGCRLWGGAHDAVLAADGGGRLELSGACVVSGHPGWWGCTVSEGSSLEAEGCTIRDHAWSGVKIHGGGSAILTNCHLSGSKGGSGMCVFDSGSRAVARQCSMSGNDAYGVVVWLGSHVELTGCQMTKNILGGLFVSGAGSRAVAHQCSMSHTSMGYGVHVTDHGCAEMTGCSADGNKDGSYHLASGSLSSSWLILTD